MQLFLKLIFFIILSSISLVSAQLSDSFRLDGYGNIELISSDNDRVDKLNFSGGFQGRYAITENISVTGQIHLKEGDNSSGKDSNSLKNYESDLKWFYLDYYFKEDITLRIGAFQFPIFKSSETGDIGYTYTWTRNPLGHYGIFGCDDFEGGEILKNFSYKDFDFLAQFSYGKSQNELSKGDGPSLKGEVDDFIGLTLKTSHDYFKLSVGYIQAKTTLNTTDKMVQNPNVDFNMYAVESEIYLDDYTLKSGLIKNHLTNVFPEDLHYYSSLEYNDDDITPYMFYSKELLIFNPEEKQGPGNRPSIKEMTKEKYSLGLRYDYTEKIAFKLSYLYEIDVAKFNGNRIDDKKTNNTFMGTINVIF